ncbi:hypothetical protein RHMOL_Rhmol02G0202300 [Rhododendron molle]|uniref:Uncharacterized protein n=1 Tax=Rhododendron molle TaxID=49168 RepID=A0ACC0PSL5_RHOML|nr:hypothetical protein RHMOL_Rhmol02G0202300 [Rhododendron molle]
MGCLLGSAKCGARPPAESHALSHVEAVTPKDSDERTWGCQLTPKRLSDLFSDVTAMPLDSCKAHVHPWRAREGDSINTEGLSRALIVQVRERRLGNP